MIVAFEEGDPDRPVIVGSVYNADQMPPYLGGGPDAKHKNDNKISGIKSNTTPGGQGYNEIRFNDTKDKEQIFIHAQGSMDVRVGSSYTTTAGGNINFTNGGVDKNGNKFGDCKATRQQGLSPPRQGRFFHPDRRPRISYRRGRRL